MISFTYREIAKIVELLDNESGKISKIRLQTSPKVLNNDFNTVEDDEYDVVSNQIKMLQSIKDKFNKELEDITFQFGTGTTKTVSAVEKDDIFVKE